MNIKIKRTHPDAVIPKYARQGDAGLDLTAVTLGFDRDGNIVYGTGLAFEIPEGYYGQIQSRSSLTQYDRTMLNTPAIIDSGYRGEVLIKFRPALVFEEDEFATGISEDARIYSKGDRIAQLIILPYPKVEFTEVSELIPTERGTLGYGSTGE